MINKSDKPLIVVLGIGVVFLIGIFIYAKATDLTEYDIALAHYNKKEYSECINALEHIQEGDNNFVESTVLKSMADSLYNIEIEKEKRIADSIAIILNQEKVADLITNAKETLSELSPFDNSYYTGSISNIEREISRFEQIENLIFELEANGSETKPYAAKISNKLKSLKTKEYPIIRYRVGKAMGKNLWEEDIEVHVFGPGNRTIEFVGGHFVTNRNIQDFQTLMGSIFREFKFTRVQYRWYEGSEYTYYKMEVPADNK